MSLISSVSDALQQILSSSVVKILIRRGAASDWTSTNPTLADGELGYESDTRKLKIGDSVSLWDDLPYFSGANDLGLPGTVPPPEAILYVPPGGTPASMGWTVSSAIVAKALGWYVAKDPKWAGGAKGGGGKVEHGSYSNVTGNANLITSADAFPANAPQVGMFCLVTGAGGSGTYLKSTITAVDLTAKTIMLADPVLAAASGTAIVQWWYNDSVAIQAALDAATVANHGRTIYLPSQAGCAVWFDDDDYTATNLAMSDYQHMRGNGKLTTILRNTPNSPYPLITNKTRVSSSGNHDMVISDMSLYGGKEWCTTNSPAIIDWAWCWDICKIERCLISRSHGNGITVLNGDNLHLIQNHIMANDGIGASIDSAHNFVSDGNLFNDNVGGGLALMLTSATNAGTDANYQYRQKGTVRETYFENNQVADIDINGNNNISVINSKFNIRDYTNVPAVKVRGGARTAYIEGNQFARTTGDNSAPVIFDSTTRDCFYGRGNGAWGNVGGAGHARYIPPQDDGVDNVIWHRSGLKLKRIDSEIMLADSVLALNADITSYARDALDASTANWGVGGTSTVTRVADTDPWGNTVTVNQLNIGTTGADRVWGQAVSGYLPVAGATRSVIMILKAAADRTPVRIRLGNATGTDFQDTYRYINSTWTIVKVTYTFANDDAATIRYDVRNIDSATSNLVVSLYGVALVSGDRWMFPVSVANAAVTRTRALISKTDLDLDKPDSAIKLTDPTGARWTMKVDATGKLTGVTAAASIPSSILYVRTSTVNVVSDGTEQLIDTFTIPLANLAVGRVFEFLEAGTLDYVATSGIMTLRMYLGPITTGALLAQVAIASQASLGTSKSWRFQGEIVIRALGATGVVAATGFQRQEISLTMADLLAIPTIDLTAGLPLTTSIQFATVNAGNICHGIQTIIKQPVQ